MEIPRTGIEPDQQLWQHQILQPTVGWGWGVEHVPLERPQVAAVGFLTHHTTMGTLDSW